LVRRPTSFIGSPAKKFQMLSASKTGT